MAMMARKGPQAVYDEMLGNNKQFRDFVDGNRGKSPEQIAAEHGLDLTAIKKMFGN